MDAMLEAVTNEVSENVESALDSVVGKDVFWVWWVFLLICAVIVTALFFGKNIINKKPLENKKKLIHKLFTKFFLQITVFVGLFLLLCPIYLTNGEFTQRACLCFFLPIYHALRFFVVESDIADILHGLSPLDNFGTKGDVLRAVYAFILYCSAFLAPVLTFTAIMSLFRNVRAHYLFFISKGKIHVFSELNEKSFALADSILKETPKCVIVFTDVLEPTSELQYDLQDSAENRGAICFRTDLESINYMNRLRNICYRIMHDHQLLKFLEKYNLVHLCLYLVI
jgi:hypothetical protein